MGGGTWRHHESCVKAKQSHEELVAIGLTDLKLDHFVPGLRGSTKISKGVLGMRNSSINRIEVASIQPSLQFYILVNLLVF